jgi:hypothetical protein
VLAGSFARPARLLKAKLKKRARSQAASIAASLAGRNGQARLGARASSAPLAGAKSTAEDPREEVTGSCPRTGPALALQTRHTVQERQKRVFTPGTADA